MNADELKARFPNASESFLRANADEPPERAIDFLDRYIRETSKLERDPGERAVGSVQVQGAVGARFLVRVTSFRRRLLDEDNLCEKYHVDLCRYSGALPGDSPATTKIEVRQEKVGSKDEEFVRVEVYKI